LVGKCFSWKPGALLGRGSDLCKSQSLSGKSKILLHQDNLISGGKPVYPEKVAFFIRLKMMSFALIFFRSHLLKNLSTYMSLYLTNLHQSWAAFDQFSRKLGNI